jgi:hypothetical protein
LVNSGISPQCRNAMAGWILERDPYGLGREAAASITIGQVMDHAESRGETDDRRIRTHLGNFCGWLIDQGLSYFDWKFLPPRSAAGEFPKKKKSEILAADVRALPTLRNHKVLRMISDAVGKPIGKVTVADLIERVTFPDFKQGFSSCRRSFLATRDLLISLGFGYDDGAFFQVGTSEHRARQLRLKYGLTRSMARKIVDIAAKEGWAWFPFD